ncbi:conserved membrane hypothetical protein [Candidatus Terasakiella magnetica]|nr:conserved membrane hypothetical protein [Candidatus Terasakiella magnetica]
MIELVRLLLLDFAPAATALYGLAFLVLSLLVGLPLRRGPVQNAAFGLLILGGAADLSLYGLRELAAPAIWFGPLTLIIALAEVWALRLLVLTDRPQPYPPLALSDAALLLVFLAGLWVVRIIQADPSSSLSSHLGWIPLYAAESLRLGRFPQPAELAGGAGILESVAYASDMIGLTILAAWAGEVKPYPAYLASSILAAGLAVTVLARALAPSRLAVAVFLVLCAALMGLDPFFRTVIGRHWGDTFQILGGALILAVLTGPDGLRPRMLAAAGAAAFLVFSRHYAAVYWAALMGIGFIAVTWQQRRLDLRPWLALTTLFLINAAREIWAILAQPTPWYPGNRQVAEMPTSAHYWVSGILHDLGLLTEGAVGLPTLVRALYLVAPVLALGLVPALRRRPGVLLLPFVVLAAPFILQALTGYRTAETINKMMIIAVFFSAWYPAHVLALCAGEQRWRSPAPAWERKAVGAASAVVLFAVILASGPLTRFVHWGFDAYRAHNVDRNIAERLQDSLGERYAEEAARPLIYTYFEPGLGLRNYIGGDVYRDFDWWGATVRGKMAGAHDLGDLVAQLGYPNLWISAPHNYGAYSGPDQERFQHELTEVETAPWVERVITFNHARFVVVRRPQSR